MQDTISNVVNRYDLTGRYLDNIAVNELNEYFNTGLFRLQAVEIINSQVSKIIQETATKFYTEQPELLRPGGNSYTTRRYSACLRDIEYYLRYASYALIAGNIDILSERVLDGLKDTYNSLSVPIGPTVRSIQILEEILLSKINTNNSKDILCIKQPFEYMINILSEKNL
uniref:Allogcyanin beta 18 subunit n=1 Tax=Compsothamnion thuioides TaxID=3097386 RepID=A0A4D6WPL5_9FLOR|nr:Allogcyanin beta 18 subunit [Compsothamnion thuyoides]